MAPRFETLIFDLGGVIVPHDNVVMYARLASRCRAQVAPEWIGAVCRERRWGTGTPIADLHRRLCQEAGYDADWPTFVEDWCCHLGLDASMLGLVQRLSGAHRAIIFSNTNLEHWRRAVELSQGALERLEACLSFEIGQEKPDLAAYEALLAGMAIDPGRAIFFDDLIANVDGARRAGLASELFTGQGPLKAFLADHGVDCS